MNNANELSEVMSEILKQSGSGIEPRVTYIVSRHGRGTRPIVKSVCNTFDNALKTLKEYKSECSDGQFVTFDVRVYNSMFDGKESLVKALDRQRGNEKD
jgi:hypothetical protein